MSEATRIVAEAPIARPPREYECDDIGNGQRFADQHGDIVRYVQAWDSWLIWDGSRWTRDGGDIEVTRLAKSTARRIYDEADVVEEDLERLAEGIAGYEGALPPQIKDEHRRLEQRLSRLRRHAWRSASGRALREMLTMAQSENGIDIEPDRLDADLHLLNTPSGTVDLRTGRLQPHDATHLCTKVARYPYDAASGCPQWEAFLRRMFDGNEELIAYVQRVLGLAVLGNPGERILPILYGSGTNGKTVFLETVVTVLGDYASTGNAEALLMARRDSGPDEDVADLCGRRIVVLTEPPGAVLNVSRVKRLTGGDRISTHRKYEHKFSFLPTHTFVVATNTRPVIPEHTTAIWDRVKLIPCGHVFEPGARLPRSEVDAMFAREGAGILAWIVRGAIAVANEGLPETPEVVQRETGGYRDDEDALGRFLQARLIEDPAAVLPVSELGRAFDAWCRLEGEAPIDVRVLGRRLNERGIRTRRSTGGRKVIEGFRLNPSEPDRVTSTNVTSAKPASGPCPAQPDPAKGTSLDVTRLDGRSTGPENHARQRTGDR